MSEFKSRNSYYLFAMKFNISMSTPRKIYLRICSRFSAAFRTPASNKEWLT